MGRIGSAIALVVAIITGALPLFGAMDPHTAALIAVGAAALGLFGKALGTALPGGKIATVVFALGTGLAALAGSSGVIEPHVAGYLAAAAAGLTAFGKALHEPPNDQ